MPFHMSAYLAMVRRVFFSPEPPIMIGRCCLDRQRAADAAPGTRSGRPAADVTVPPSSSVRHAATASSSQSSRWPKPDPKSMPWAVCSSSNQAPPMPRIARPSLMWSRVVASLAVRPGLRNVLAPTSRPRRDALGGHRPGGQQRPALEDGLHRVAEDGVEVVPGPDVVVAEPLDLARGGELFLHRRALRPGQDAQLEVRHRSSRVGIGRRVGTRLVPGSGLAVGHIGSR